MAGDGGQAALVADEPRRFFVEPEVLGGPSVTLTGDLAHRISRVLRYGPGDEVILTAGGPKESRLRLRTVSAKSVTGDIVGEQDGPAEPKVQVVLYQALIRANRFDFALEKGTEAGVSRFVPVVCARTQGHGEEPSSKRAERWRRLVVEAAEQCGRGRLPEISDPLPFAEALRTAPVSR